MSWILYYHLNGLPHLIQFLLAGDCSVLHFGLGQTMIIGTPQLLHLSPRNVSFPQFLHVIHSKTPQCPQTFAASSRGYLHTGHLIGPRGFSCVQNGQKLESRAINYRNIYMDVYNWPSLSLS
jgi:hypothetical protein